DQLCVLSAEIEDEYRFKLRGHFPSLYQPPRTSRGHVTVRLRQTAAMSYSYQRGDPDEVRPVRGVPTALPRERRSSMLMNRQCAALTGVTDSRLPGRNSIIP